jgi:3',5'-cyclic AMP phosphodiesterase CpdA
MIVAQISDTHIALDTPDSDQRIGDFERTIADINALDPAPDVIVHTGDIVHNGRADEYAKAAEIFAAARAPVYVLPGNKDNRENLYAAFSAHKYLTPGAPFIDYAIEDYPIRLIGLDTLSEGNNKGDFGRERIERMMKLIGADSKKPVAIFLHHPPFEVPVGPDPLNFVTAEAMAELRAALQRSGRIAGIFCGHVHRLTEGHVGKIPATVVTSIATTLRKGSYPAEMNERPIYYIHTFDPAGGFATETRIVGTERATRAKSKLVTAKSR